MNLLLIGGHTRNIGKTALVVDIVRAFPEARWTAVKITQYGHGVCSVNGDACGCAPDQHTFSLDEETSREDRTDTSRFLVAGAARSFWLRTKQGFLAEGMPQLREALRGAGNVIIESNSLMGLLRPALYLVVLDPAHADFKDSARKYLDRADAIVLRSVLPSGVSKEAWPALPSHLMEGRPIFHQALGSPLPDALCNFLRNNYFRASDSKYAPPEHLSS